MKGSGRKGGGQHELQIGTLVLEANGQVDISWRSGADLPIATGSTAHAYINKKVSYCSTLHELKASICTSSKGCCTAVTLTKIARSSAAWLNLCI